MNIQPPFLHSIKNNVMKFLLLLSALLFLQFSFPHIGHSQSVEGTVTVQARQDLLSVLPPDVAYFMPDFEEASIYFTDGTVSSGKVNICLVDNTIRFIAPSGDTLLMSQGDRVLRILAADTLILKAEGCFARQIAVFGPYSLSERRQLELNTQKQEQMGGYGTLPPTSTALSASMMSLDPSRKFETAADISYRLEKDFVLTDGTDVFKARAAAFYRIFPDMKQDIRKFIREHSIDMSSREDLLGLFLFCARETEG